MHDTTHHFDPDNRAYQRFLTTTREHLAVAEWRRTADDRLVMMTLTDVASGDMFTVAVIDSIEDTSPHVLIALDSRCEMTAHGVFAGVVDTRRYAPHLVISGADVVGTRPTPLHSPDLTELPADAWVPVPADIAQAAYPALVDAPAAIAVLLDRDRGLFCAVGPFPADASAADWPLPAGVDPQVAHLVVALFGLRVTA